ncbi:ERAD-associated protein, partial [Cryomyces antarcticus]
MAEERSRSQKFYNYPEPRAFDVPYKPPPPPANPVVRGLPLYFGASLVSSVSSIQNLLWSNAGFSGLRGLPELEDIAPRYDPTVIPVQDSSTSVQKNTD